MSEVREVGDLDEDNRSSESLNREVSGDESSCLSDNECTEGDGELDVTKTKDGSVCKRILKKGSGVHNPVAGAEATISFYRQSAPDDVTEITYCVGDPGSKVPHGLDLALRHMNVEEHSQITIFKDDNIGATKENPIIFELILKSFEKINHLSAISPFSEQMVYAKLLRDKANDFIKKCLFDPAIELYSRLDDDLQYTVANGPNEEKELNENVIAVRLNLALAHLKMGGGAKCIEFCEKVLSMSVNNEKALFRIGQAHLLRRDHEAAYKYFEKIVKQNSKNTAAVNQLRVCTDVINRSKEQQRRMYRNLFNQYKDIGLGDVGSVPEPVTVGEKTSA